jgi:hypothetical protein
MTDSTAISAQGSTIEISTGSGGSKNISAVTVGYPTKLASTAHGFNNGDRVDLAAFTGANAADLNGKRETVLFASADAFSVAVNSIGHTITTTGPGTATPVAFTAIANFKSWSGFDGAANIIDVTHLGSEAEEIRPGIARFGAFSIVLDWNTAEASHEALLAHQLDRTQESFRLTLPDGEVDTFSAYVMKCPSAGGVDKVVDGTVEFRITGPVTRTPA